MTPDEWKKLAGEVADRMKEYTRLYVTPIRTSTEHDVWLLGTGSYVGVRDQTILLTCEHVVRSKAQVENQFWGSDNVFVLPDPFVVDVPLDVAFAPIRESIWNKKTHAAKALLFDDFASAHQPADDELLFFRGFAGENEHYGFGVHEANATAYCSQQPHQPPVAANVFEIMWVPDRMEFTKRTSDEMKATLRHDDPRGLSGSLVWNTRYVEKTAADQQWSPEDAVVTGLLRWHIPDRKTVAALRVEHLRRWLASKL